MPTRVPYRPLPIDEAAVIYEYGPDSVRREDVSDGETSEER